MAITSRDQLINAMANNSTRLVIDKASVANTATGQFHSLWRATGQPGQAAIPTSADICDMSMTGALQFTPQTDPARSYLAVLENMCSVAGSTLEIHDRLIHMGGLVGNVTTAQNVTIDLNGLTAHNIVSRIGDTNYSDIQWWLEWYADTGSTNTSITVNVTYNDGTTGNLTATGNVGTTRRASYLFPLNYLIPAASAGKYIRGVNTITLSASTGTAGNLGVTATRYRAANYAPIANVRFTADWAQLGLPEIPNEACLMLLVNAGTTSTGLVRATGKVAHG